MKNFDYEKAVKRYNGIMFDICREYLTIGTNFSEDTDGWTIRDMVAECDYTLSLYYEEGNANEELRHLDEDSRKSWKSETGKLRRFINAYKPFINDFGMVMHHCSQYDA